MTRRAEETNNVGVEESRTVIDRVGDQLLLAVGVGEAV